MKTFEELKKMEVKKLLDELSSLRKELFKIAFEVKNGQAKNIHDIKKHRRQIARIKTLIAQNPLNQAS